MAFVTPFLGLGIKSSTSPRTCRTPARAARWTMNEGKGFGGGEATRDPEPTEIDPTDPKGKQKAIHPAESFAEYQARVAREKAEKEAQK